MDAQKELLTPSRGRDNLQRYLGKLEGWAITDCMQLNKGSGKLNMSSQKGQPYPGGAVWSPELDMVVLPTWDTLCFYDSPHLPTSTSCLTLLVFCLQKGRDASDF